MFLKMHYLNINSKEKYFADKVHYILIFLLNIFNIFIHLGNKTVFEFGKIKSTKQVLLNIKEYPKILEYKF